MFSQYLKGKVFIPGQNSPQITKIIQLKSAFLYKHQQTGMLMFVLMNVDKFVFPTPLFYACNLKKNGQILFTNISLTI